MLFNFWFPLTNLGIVLNASVPVQSLKLRNVDSIWMADHREFWPREVGFPAQPRLSDDVGSRLKDQRMKGNTPVASLYKLPLESDVVKSYYYFYCCLKSTLFSAVPYEHMTRARAVPTTGEELFIEPFCILDRIEQNKLIPKKSN